MINISKKTEKKYIWKKRIERLESVLYINSVFRVSTKF